MRTFKTQDKHWEISLSVGLFRRLKGEIGLDLMNPNSPLDKDGRDTVMTRLQLDLSTFLTLLSALTRKQREAVSVSDDDFDEMLTPEVIGEARKAFFEEYLSFFSKSGMTTVVAIADKTIEALDDAAGKIKGISTTGLLSGVLQQSAGSTPAA